MVVTSADVIVGGESQSSSTLALDTTALAFEHVLASLARRSVTIVQPPPLPEPDTPDPDWQRGREISGRQSVIVMSVTAISSIPQLGFGGGPSSHGQQHTALLGASSWDRYEVNAGQSLGRQATAWDNPAHRLDIRPRRHATEWDQYDADNDGFRRRRATAWDNPAHRMDEPESPYEEWQRGRGDTGRHRLIISPATSVDSHQHLGIVGLYARNAIQQPCDRYGTDVELFPGCRFTAWDNPTHRENAAGIHTVDSDYSNPSKPKDTSDSKVIATLGPQISEVIVSSGFPKTGDNIQVVISSLGKPCCEGIVSRGPHTKCAVLNSCTDPDSLQLHKGERIDTIHGKKDEISPIVSPLKDDFHITGDDDMAKAIKKVLEQNFEIDEDVHSQALLFKNLWLEAEAKLCSISYETRFERMRIQMEGIKLKAPKEDEDVADLFFHAEIFDVICGVPFKSQSGNFVRRISSIFPKYPERKPLSDFHPLATSSSIVDARISSSRVVHIRSPLWYSWLGEPVNPVITEAKHKKNISIECSKVSQCLMKVQ
ncbi:hypothetical protein SASPL_156734 [Salvia splendens]|uniref:Uncharacterized protein n=1 Tax=Salvia splendens TaxID=180675 RepID=A0A8X8VWG6_SALSN|nr:hypothetical protein SASPL_156734 [Salvia splendens]